MTDMKNYKFVSSKEAADFWGVPQSDVSRWCKEGKIKGAKKENGSWRVPIYEIPQVVIDYKKRKEGKQ